MELGRSEDFVSPEAGGYRHPGANDLVIAIWVWHLRRSWKRGEGIKNGCGRNCRRSGNYPANNHKFDEKLFQFSSKEQKTYLYQHEQPPQRGGFHLPKEAA